MTTTYDMAKSGMSIAEIAQELNIAENTVRQAIRNVQAYEEREKEARVEFANLFCEMKELLTSNRKGNKGYVPPTKTKYFISDDLDECMDLYPKRRAISTVLSHMNDVIDQLTVDLTIKQEREGL